jgi:dihydroxyacetone kinase phosphoprotein-dependent L subunit
VSRVSLDAALIVEWVGEFAAAVAADRENLTALDAAIGDADHGANLDRGLSACVEALAGASLDSPGAACQLVGRTLISKVGGASGPLYGTAFREIGKSLGTSPEVDAEELVTALRAGLAGIQRLGGAHAGDKTMVDAYLPAVDALDTALAAGTPLPAAARAAAEAARSGAEATIPLQARKGRASYLGPRSVNHQDPGATSTSHLFITLAAALERPAAAASG